MPHLTSGSAGRIETFRGPGEPPFKLYGLLGYALNYGIAFGLWLMWPLPALLFFGVSLLLAGVRGYVGCEILALSNLLKGRRDELACAILSPVDNIERSVMSMKLTSGHRRSIGWAGSGSDDEYGVRHDPMSNGPAQTAERPATAIRNGGRSERTRS